MTTDVMPVLTKTNHYEDLIDEETIDLVAGGNPNISEYIRKLSQSEQRLRILSILDEDRGLFMGIKKIIDGEYIPKCEHIKNVLKMMRVYVEVSDTEKKKFGEVMTPIWLVEEMLDKLPADVWSNPDLKWLDPANGIGVFPSVIVSRLMVGLSEAIPDNEARYRHIVESMLHVCELQKKNMFLFLTTFDPKDEYMLNIFTGSFLSKEFDEHCKNIWGIEKFDVIVGNPPYQELKPGFKKSQSIWPFFVEKGISYIARNGYLSMVHPSSWREPFGMFKKTQKLILNLDIEYLELHDVKDGVRTFGVSTTYDYYTIRNSKTKDFLTNVKFTDGTELKTNLRDVDFIPNYGFIDSMNLIAKSNEEKVVMIADSSYHHYTNKQLMSPVQNNTFVYPCVYTISQNGKINKYFASRNDRGHFGVPKVIWSSGASDVIIDKNGEFGLTEFAYAIIDDVENLENIQRAMKSQRFIETMRPLSFGATHRYNRKIISLFRKDFWKEFI